MVDRSPWYAEGLHFTCTKCGNCCTGESGTVRVSEGEIDALAEELEIPVVEFRRRYTRRLRGAEVSLVERSNGDCVFWSSEPGCTVYRKRPRQCRTWPFWRAVVHSRERWDEEARGCPGMNGGALHDREEIEALANCDGTRLGK
jgi:Fe-S-cluster containining protein